MRYVVQVGKYAVQWFVESAAYFARLIAHRLDRDRYRARVGADAGASPA
jgi:hypothetical protein